MIDVSESNGMGMLNFNSDSKSNEEEKEIEDAVEKFELEAKQQSVRRKLEYEFDMTVPSKSPEMLGFGEIQGLVSDLQQDIDVKPVLPPQKVENINKNIKIDLFKRHNEELCKKKQILSKRAQSPGSKVYDRLYAAAQHQNVKHKLEEVNKAKLHKFTPKIDEGSEAMLRNRGRKEKGVEKILYNDFLKRQKKKEQRCKKEMHSTSHRVLKNDFASEEKARNKLAKDLLKLYNELIKAQPSIEFTPQILIGMMIILEIFKELKKAPKENLCVEELKIDFSSRKEMEEECLKLMWQFLSNENRDVTRDLLINLIFTMLSCEDSASIETKIEQIKTAIKLDEVSSDWVIRMLQLFAELSREMKCTRHITYFATIEVFFSLNTETLNSKER